VATSYMPSPRLEIERAEERIHSRGTDSNRAARCANTSLERTRRKVYGAMDSGGLSAVLACRQVPKANSS
jgi:hypothetical protein